MMSMVGILFGLLPAVLDAAERRMAKDAVLQSIPGVGPVLTRTMLGHAPELDTLGPKQIAALNGSRVSMTASAGTREAPQRMPQAPGA